MGSTMTLLSLVGYALAGGLYPPPATPLLDDATLQGVGMARYWQANLPLAARDSLDAGYLVDDTLYVVSAGGTVFSVTADVGLIRWAEKISEPDFTVYRPAHLQRAGGKGPVVIPTTTKTVIFDRYSGDVLQSFTPPFAAGSSAIGYGNLLFMGSSDGRFYALTLQSRRSLEPFKLWDVVVGGPVTAAPTFFDGNLLLFASQSGWVFACRGEDKGLIWSFETGAPILGDPAVDDSGAYVASTDRILYKLNTATGRILWRKQMQRPMTDGPTVVAHSVYQFVPRDGLVVIDADTGADRWRMEDGKSLASHSAGGDVIATLDGRLKIVDSETGDLKHTVDVPGLAAAVVNTLDDAVYLLGKDGRVLCARAASVPYLKRQQVMAARARLNKPPAGAATQASGQGSKTATDKAEPDPLRSRYDRP